MHKKLMIGMADRLIELAEGEDNSGLSERDTIRIQIRLAIRTHLEKQWNILRRGHNIKALTLFFINAVEKFRDPASPDGRGEILRMFDEEYAGIIERRRTS